MLNYNVLQNKTFDILPDELIVLIFEYLFNEKKDLKNLANAMQVCRKWRDIINNDEYFLKKILNKNIPLKRFYLTYQTPTTSGLLSEHAQAFSIFQNKQSIMRNYDNTDKHLLNYSGYDLRTCACIIVIFTTIFGADIGLMLSIYFSLGHLAPLGLFGSVVGLLSCGAFSYGMFRYCTNRRNLAQSYIEENERFFADDSDEDEMEDIETGEHSINETDNAQPIPKQGGYKRYGT